MSRLVGLLNGVRDLVDERTFEDARRRLLEERVDINVGVMGVSLPRGQAFLADWSERMEQGESLRILLMDEMLSVALAAKHRHFLAAEKWNCPADGFFRRTSLKDADVVHYFADGMRVSGLRLGRNPATRAGRFWNRAFRGAGKDLALDRWTRKDPSFKGP